MSQTGLANALQEQGLTHVRQTTISRIEKAEQPARLVEASAIAQALSANLKSLLLPPNETFHAMAAHTLHRETVVAQERATEWVGNVIRGYRTLGMLVARLAEDPDEPDEIAKARDFLAVPIATYLDQILADAERETDRKDQEVKLRREQKGSR